MREGYFAYDSYSKQEKCRMICEELGIDPKSATMNNPAGGFTSEGLTLILCELKEEVQESDD